MDILTDRNVLYIFRRTLNRIDYRLVDHGQRVAYLVMRMLRIQGGFTQKQIAELCVLALWHDIGAYKVEEIRSMTAVKELIHFEAQNVLPHSVYGYLFYKELLDRYGLADTLLYHHISYDKTLNSSCKNKKAAMILFVADRYDLLTTLQKNTSPIESLEMYSGTIFDPESVVLLKRLQEEEDLYQMMECGDYIEDLFEAFDGMEFSSVRLVDYLWLLAFSIDFRSPFTVTHTIQTASISMALADLMGLCCDDRQQLYLGSIVHDLGKISTPIEILEKPGKLTTEEFEIMKHHVVDSETILTGCVAQEIIDIAVRHHEKMDGSGYPHGLSSKDLTVSQRILAVADVMSALIGRRSYKDPMPPEQVKSILQSNAQNNKLCPDIVRRVVENYDIILDSAKTKAERQLEQYDKIMEQYPSCLREMTQLVTPIYTK